ncbi:hypothetical protein GCM10027610_087360 [Dactylosporangium cerinum]
MILGMPLLLLSLAQFLLALDYSIVYVALPGMAADLGLDLAAAQWVVSAYAVPFAGFLLVGGRLADRVGAGRLFVAAMVIFGVASIGGGSRRPAGCCSAPGSPRASPPRCCNRRSWGCSARCSRPGPGPCRCGVRSARPAWPPASSSAAC